VAIEITPGSDGGRAPASAWNAQYLETLYAQWKREPATLSETWQAFFEGFELSMCPRACVAAESARDQSRVASLIYAYRSQGHRIAAVDPLGGQAPSYPQLELAQSGLAERDLGRVFDTGHLGGSSDGDVASLPARASLGEIIAILREIYCRSVGVEYVHIQDTEVRRWLQAQMEPTRNRPPFERAKRLETLRLLVDAELFETFIGTRYPGQKRFSLEGAEALVPAVHAIVELAPELGAVELVVGMAHRGRLNLLANILDKSYETIFSEFEENLIPSMVGGDGDVKYHKGFSSDHMSARGGSVHLTLTANPSHLEAVDPVVQGRTRAKQRRRDDTAERRRVVPLLIHGDASFSGQGLVAETLNLSQLEGYRTGGTVHLIVNNQIGFTTLPTEARSTPYCTDVAKMIEAPIFHVSGDDPEAVVHVAELALRFRQRFGRDVVVDMICYRRHGHNEGDEPAFTQPVLYRKIKDHPGVRRLYTQRLIEEGVLSEDEGRAIGDELRAKLQRAFESVKASDGGAEGEERRTPAAFEGVWAGLDQPYSDQPVETGVSHPDLCEVARSLFTAPEGFALNPKVARQLPQRLHAVVERQPSSIDWATAELLAFGTLLLHGVPVRLSGQDTARGTFSQRHAVWQDMQTQQAHVPLNHVGPGQARFCVYNSMLSEAAVLGFEYGYSLDEPQMLIVWEAQFGDFANGAQVIIDQFVISSYAKWRRASGLVLLLPHGYEGQGPEHSNAYLERYLAACAEHNLQVCNLSEPAQYFHLLRRQVGRPFRRPLVVMAPKSLLRHPRCVSDVERLLEGHFAEILDDPSAPELARRLVLCSGKLYYDLLEGRARLGREHEVALVRVEQLYPFCDWRMLQVLQRYPKLGEVVWAQEESQNRGAWSYMAPMLRTFFPDLPLRYAGRPASASPATGSLRVHRRTQEEVVRQALGG
jgi:2-oxoglutarate dehydrogenase E1 component